MIIYIYIYTRFYDLKKIENEHHYKNAQDMFIRFYEMIMKNVLALSNIN